MSWLTFLLRSGINASTGLILQTDMNIFPSSASGVAFSVPEVLLKGGVRCKRIVNGLWQTAGNGWGVDASPATVEIMANLALSGFTSFDGADIYGPAESLMGATKAFLHRKFPEGHWQLQSFTKYVPAPKPTSLKIVESAIDTSAQKMGILSEESIDLLQFHWWDYSKENDMMNSIQYLNALRERGRIRSLGLTNFDTIRLLAFIDAGIPISVNQVQFSVVDTRPLVKLAPVAAAHGVYLLSYGTLLGGLLSEKYLNAPEPSRKLELTPSKSKYLNIISAWGGWRLFQELLAALKLVADRHACSIANVATKWVLDQQSVGAVIIGIRPGVTDHAADNARTFSITLTASDVEVIAEVQRKSNNLFETIGDTGDEYR